MRPIIFDTQALLKLYLDEEGAERVENHLKRIFAKQVKGYINIVTLAELYYVLFRIKKELAEDKERNLRSFGVKIISLGDNSRLWKEAALIKAKNSLSLADAFGAATAIALRGTLVTGANAEFDTVELLRVERI